MRNVQGCLRRGRRMVSALVLSGPVAGGGGLTGRAHGISWPGATPWSGAWEFAGQARLRPVGSGGSGGISREIEVIRGGILGTYSEQMA